MAVWDSNELDSLNASKGADATGMPKSVGGFSSPSEENKIWEHCGPSVGGLSSPSEKDKTREPGGACVGGFSSPSEDASGNAFNDPLGSVPWAGIDPGQALQNQDTQPSDGDFSGGLSLTGLSENMDLSGIEWHIHDLMSVPQSLKGKCKWLRDQEYPVLKCYNRRSFLLFFGALWSLMSFPFLGLPLVQSIIEGRVVMGPGTFTNNTGLPDDVAFILFSSIFVIIGVVFLIVGIRQVFMSTWMTFKGGYVEVRHAFFRKGESKRFLLNNCYLETDCTSRENNQLVYRVLLHSRRNGKKVLIVRGLKGDLAQIYPDYLEHLFEQCRKSAKARGVELPGL